MTPSRCFRTGRVACTAALLGASAVVLHAQTNDESRLTLGMSAGYIGSAFLWDVPAQPIASTFDPPDIFHLHRVTHADITISGAATFFPGPHLGYAGEFTYVGLANLDACTVVQDSGDAELITACNALKGAQNSASTTLIQGGLVYRPLSRSFVQPYLKVLGGVAFTPTSSIAMESDYGALADTALILTIYKDDNWREIRPTWTAALGIATAPSQGYQLHVELRESWLPMGTVTGSTIGQGFVPPNTTVIKAFPSILVGFDIVLAKRRGRRY